MTRTIRVFAAALLIGCAASVPDSEGNCPAGTLCASIVRGLMGEGDSACALDGSRRFLDVKLITDCPTTTPLVLTVHNADPYDNSFQPVREERGEKLNSRELFTLRTKTALSLNPKIKQLRLQVKARCEEGDDVAFRYGDARCDVPPAP